MTSLNTIQLIAIWLLPVLFAITLHEAAHGWVAGLFGDRTAQMLGRVTLNPLKHIDPVGTVLVPAVLLLMGSLFGGTILFGWAKPVPVTVRNLHNPRRDMAFVAAAGPLANLVMALFWALLIHVAVWLLHSWPSAGLPLVFMGVGGVFVNTILMVLNLVPIPPLDGGRVAMSLLPGPWAWQLSRVEPFGILIVLALLVTGVLGAVFWPVVTSVQMGLNVLTGLTGDGYIGVLLTILGRG